MRQSVVLRMVTFESSKRGGKNFTGRRSEADVTSKFDDPLIPLIPHRLRRNGHNTVAINRCGNCGLNTM